MKETWAARVARAKRLVAERFGAADLLRFYARLLEAQEQSASLLESAGLAGSIETDMGHVLDGAPAVLRVVREAGSAELAEEASRLMDGGPAALEEALLSDWASPSGDRFFAKALTQPYAATLASRGIRFIGRPARRDGRHCPVCGGSPQLSILDAADASGSGGGRSLLCATCLTPWPVPRLCCAACGEGDETRLGYFEAPELPHVVVEVCEVCRSYLKRIDRSKLGFAVPLVDEVAAAALDLWAVEQGYRKIEINLVGL